MDDLTLWELNGRVVGHNTRERAYWSRFARVMAPLCTGLFRKRVRPEDLLPEMFPEKELSTKEARIQELKEIKKTLKIK